MFKDRLEPREIPRKMDPRPTREIIETLIEAVEADSYDTPAQTSKVMLFEVYDQSTS